LTRGHEWRLFLIVAFAVLLLTVVRLPPMLAPLKPFWAGLLLIYCALEMPRVAHLGVAFAFGLLLDVLAGSLLGEHALRLVILTHVALRFRFRLRFFPVSQQALAVFGLLLNDRILALWVRLFGGEGWPSLGFWLSPLVGMLLWPWLFLLMDRLRLRGRNRATRG
jgi:rod shape-determining protein MreD